jgi:hypothetical protein
VSRIAKTVPQIIPGDFMMIDSESGGRDADAGDARLLTVRGVIQDAERRAGHGYLGHSIFDGALAVLTASYRSDARVHAYGARRLHGELVAGLAARIAVDHAVAEAPKIREVEIERPIFIVSFPRTGSTLLLNVLAQSEGARTFRHWELLNPAPPPDPETEATDPRRAVSRAWIEDYYAHFPELRAIHAFDTDGPDECVRLFTHTFMTMQFLNRGYMPGYARWFLMQDRTPAYEYHRLCLQTLCFKRPGNPVIVKDPFHIWSLDALRAVYPDACIVHIHRDPVESLASWANYVTGVLGICSDRIEPGEVGELWLDLFRVAVRQLAGARTGGDSRAILDVRYTDVAARPFDAARRILDHFGFVRDRDETLSRISAYLSRHPPKQHVSHPYSLERFGFTADRLRSEFRDYREQIRDDS